MTKVEVTGPFKKVKDYYIGYCSCGREVNTKQNECPLCGAELDWINFREENREND